MPPLPAYGTLSLRHQTVRRSMQAVERQSLGRLMRTG